jgi:hypothetical protein
MATRLSLWSCVRSEAVGQTLKLPDAFLILL